MQDSKPKDASYEEPLVADPSRVARVVMWSLIGLHLGLLVLGWNDYFVSIDSGYHVSLGRYFAEHFTAYWDHINYGPFGRPNLQGPLLHICIGALGWIMGGQGDDYVLANTLLAILQWLAAIFTVVYFSRRLGGDWAALFAAVLLSGDFLASAAFSVGIPSGWIFILTPWAIHTFLRDRWLLSALLVSASIYVHLGGYATAPLGVLMAAAITGRWRGLLIVGTLSVAFTAPYSVHLLDFRSWYIGETGHVAVRVSPLILVLGLIGFVGALPRPRRHVFLLAWALSSLAWLFQDYTRFLSQSTLAAVVLGGIFLAGTRRGWVGVRWRPWFAATAVIAATVAPMSLPSLALRSTWVLGLRFPRMMDWEEARTLAEVVGENQLDGRLVYVYNHSFAPALAVFTPITVERGHWVEVQPRPDPSDWVSAGVKAYVMPLPPGDAMLRELEKDGLLTIHGGSERSAVLTLTRAGDLESVASLVSGIMEQESLWMADHAVNNTLEPIMEVLSAEGVTVRRTRLLEQRIHAGRIAVAHLILAYALETDHPERAEEARREVRGFCSIAAFLSDEWSLDFIDAERHENLRKNFQKLGHQAGELGLTHLPSPALDEILDKLFDEYFWAA